MSPALNPLVTGIGSPPIPEAQGWLGRYTGRHGPPIDLSQAVPGYPPHPGMLERLAASAGSGEAARYGPITGDERLRQAYADHVSSGYGGRVDASEVAITAGCNLAFVVAMMLVAGRSDAVLLPTPWYFNHEMTLAMLGIEPRALPGRPEAGFVPDPADAEALIDPSVRALVLVTPNNPTGAVYPASLIEAFAALCRRRGIWLVVDETYRDFLPQGQDRAHGLLAGEGWREGLIQLYSFSKAYCIPGHRAGAMVADASVIVEIAKILDCLQICAPRAGQAALVWGIEGLGAWREANRREINRRSEGFRAAMSGLPGWKLDSIGAYFAYLRHPFAGVPARRVAEALAVERGVLGLPGSYFGPGQEDHLRMAFANVGQDAIGTLGRRLAGFAV